MARPINLDKVPVELQQQRQWVLWKYIDRDGERTKVPFQATGRAAKSNDPETWSDIISVQNRLASGDGWAGVGYVFRAESGIVGIDLDGCRNPETGEVAEWAKQIIRDLNSYGEVSPSQTGVKIWIRATLPKGAGKKREIAGAPLVSDKRPAIEVYDRGRYFAVTGWRLGGVSPLVEPRQATLDAILAKYLTTHEDAPGIAPTVGIESDVVERARAYLGRIEPAISGQGGHNQTFKAACVLVLGFGLSEGDAFRVLVEWNAGCNPPWSERDLRRKIAEANKQGGERNYLRIATREQWDATPLPEYTPKQSTTQRAEQQAAPKSPVTIVSLRDACNRYLDGVISGARPTVTIGIPEIDEALDGGVEAGEMVVMAARPSHGKSAIAMQCIHGWTFHGEPSMIVSEEMSHLALGKRSCQFITSIPREYWFSKAGEVREHIADHFEPRADSFVVEGCRSAGEAADQIRRAVRERGVSRVVVDYAQLLQAPGKSRYEIVTNTSVIMRQITNETKVVLILLAQLGRDTEKRDAFLPKMSDLKESGQLEQDADVILFLCWPWKIDSQKSPEQYTVYVAKNRNRSIVKPVVDMKFDAARQFISSGVAKEVEQTEASGGDWFSGWNNG